MDLLSKAYSTASDDEEDGSGGGEGSKNWNPLPSPPPKRSRPETPSANIIRMPVYRYPNPPPEPPMPGRYISKRQRAALSVERTGSEENKTNFDATPGAPHFSLSVDLIKF